MPSKADLRDRTEQLLKRAGITTVYHGIWLPDEHADWPVELYPVAGLHEEATEKITASDSPGGFHLEGRWQVDIWQFSGSPSGPNEAAPTTQTRLLDVIHDAILHQLGLAYTGDDSGLLTSQMVLNVDGSSWEPWFWYRGVPNVGARMFIDYVLHYTP